MGDNIYTKVVSSGSYLPRRVVSNNELSSCVSTSDEWIVSRTGICERRVASDDETTCMMSISAARQAIDRASCDPADVDCIIVATTTPDSVIPAVACSVQHGLGCLSAAAFDLQSACSGFVHALSVADAFIRSKQFKRILVIGAEVFSRIVNWKDRSTCVLFGDGAGAMLLESSPVAGILASHISCDGKYSDILQVPCHLDRGSIVGDPYVHMEGSSVFKLAVHFFESSINAVLGKAGVDISTVDWVVPHQANIRIIDSLFSRLGVDRERAIITLPFHGNTSAASVPLAFDWGCIQGFIKSGNRCLLTAFGSGLSWGSVLVDM
ncbi:MULTISPECIES: beta-ketoacyl-ACP synthase III [Candidatus Ichthyocystis]|uniref:Beta-ketoacyl-[acyl-carrier-protein] synthase III n=1 Tax=Candidatus Ichthyocystis hellenicum TaxID=1561003 RepID=A0A0S4M631_9BURK|nr:MULTISPECIES: beta-ketoacyl-ACP synthase III [Ichthyocystis]CUT17592.1 3-oxoacyl-[acyl-carrier-protein] synthase III [Candidatus Ichthyocystis hellenicum]